MPIKFHIESFSPNFIYVKNLKVGTGIDIKEVEIHYHIDNLLIFRSVDSVIATSGIVDINRIIEDFRTDRKPAKKSEGHFPNFKIKLVKFNDITIYPTSEFDIWINEGRFSFSMGSKSLNLNDIFVRTVDIPKMMVFIDSTAANMEFNFEGLNILADYGYGNLDTLRFFVKGYSLRIPINNKDSVILIMDSYEGKLGNIRGKKPSIRWSFKGNLGNIRFRCDTLSYEDITSSDVRGTIDLTRFPDIFLRYAEGNIFGGNVELSLYIDSLMNIYGKVFSYSISPVPNIYITARAVFSLIEGRLTADGYVKELISDNPKYQLQDFNFSVKSEDFENFDYDITGRFLRIKGWYNTKTEDFYADFDISKPTRLVSLENIRIYTFEGNGNISKSGDSVNIYIKHGTGWYVVVDTFRIDRLELMGMKINTSFKRPDMKNTLLNGYFNSSLSFPDSAKVEGFVSYNYGKLYGKISIKSKTYGDIYAEVEGIVRDTNDIQILMDSLRYNYKDSIDIALKSVGFEIKSETLMITVPKNYIFGGRAYGSIVVDRRERNINGRLDFEDIYISPIMAKFVPSENIYIDTMDLALQISGTIDDPNIQGKLKTGDGMLMELIFDSLDLNFSISKDRFTVKDSKVMFSKNSIYIEVFQYFFQSKVIYGHVFSKYWDTDELLPYFLPDSSYAEFDLFLSGKLDTPSVYGYLSWKARSININNNVIANPKIYALFNSEKIILIPKDDANIFNVGGGKIYIGGVIRTDGFIDSLSVRIDKAFLQLDPDISANLSGNLFISGNILNSILVEGDITSDELYFSKPLSAFLVQTVQKNQKPVIYYNIHFSAPRRLFINSPIYSQVFTSAVMELDAEMSADLIFQKFSQTSNITYGYLEVLRGNVYLLDKVFSIDNGRIELFGTQGNVSINSSSTLLKPSTDSLIGNVMDSVKVFVSISGDINKPKVEFWSQPYMSSSELIYMLLGRQGGLISALIGTGLRRGLRVQELSIKRMGDVSQLIFGTYIGKNLYIRYLSNRIGETNYRSIRTQYFINNNISIYGERLEDEYGTKYGTGVNIRIRF